MESAVKTVKNILGKCKADGSDPYLALLMYLNTPQQGYETSPAQRFMSRRTRTVLPITRKLLAPEVVDTATVIAVQTRRKEVQAQQYDKNTKPLPPLQVNDNVVIQPQPGQGMEWRKGVVKSQIRNRTYRVKTSDGSVLVRNRKFLRQVPKPQTQCDSESVYDPTDCISDETVQSRIVPIKQPRSFVFSPLEAARSTNVHSPINIATSKDQIQAQTAVSDKSQVVQSSASQQKSVDSQQRSKLSSTDIASADKTPAKTNSTIKSSGVSQFIRDRPRRKCKKTLDSNFVYSK